MIIVSQDKTDIINLDRLTEIKAAGKDICVVDHIEQKYGYIIATYKTEERAKEVLQKIIQSYREYRTAECDGYTNVLEETAVYEMPEK